MRHSHEYYLGLSPEQRKALANQAKTTVYYLHVMALGRPVSLDLALRADLIEPSAAAGVGTTV